MAKKRSTGVDSRQEPIPSGTPVERVPNYRVDRVFAPTPKPREPAASPPPATTSASQAATALLERTRPGRQSAPPPFGPEGTVDTGDTELSLRRQLSRLQRQLSEAQRELANKDDELAAEVEKRLSSAAVSERMLEQMGRMQAELDELLASQARMAGIEQRLQDSIATADELAQLVEKERGESLLIKVRAEEVTDAFDETRARWNAERSMLEERYASELARLEAQRKQAADTAEQALAAATTRLRETHDAEVAELRAAHERSLSTLRGELEPKVAEARNLAEERERLASEIAALEADAVRTAEERDQAQSRELSQLAEAKAAELAAQARTHAAELARVTAERDEQILALQGQVRGAEVRQQAFEEQAEALRETQKKLQRELAEAKERSTGLETDKISLEERLIGAGQATAKLVEDNKLLREQVELAASESRRTSLDRLRFVAYLEEGLALLGALPPTEVPPPVEMEVIRDDEPPDA